MFQQGQSLFYRFRYLITGFLGILIIIGGGLVLLHLSNFNQTSKVIANQGHSLLYVLADADRHVTLSMVRTRDGQQLWQYHLPGDLVTNGPAPRTADQAVQIFNGNIYFLVAQPSQLYPKRYLLLALHASNGQPLWQNTITVPSLSFIGVAAGVVCLWANSNLNQPSINTLAVYGYQAETGALSWKRTLYDIGGNNAVPQMPFIIDNILYFMNNGTSSAQKRIIGNMIIAVQPTNGQTLWSYQSPNSNLTLFSGENDVLVVYSSIGSIMQPKNRQAYLLGLSESTGTLLWQQASDILSAYPFSGGAYTITPPQNNSIYTLSTGSNLSDLILKSSTFKIAAIRVSDGTILWRQTIHYAQDQDIMNFARLGNFLYLDSATDNSTSIHPHLITASLIAWNADTGQKRWQHDDTQLDFNWQFSSLGGDSNTSLFLQQGPMLYTLRPADGTVLRQYTLPESFASPLTVADGQTIFTYVSSQSSDSDVPIIHSLSFRQDQTKPLWDYHFQMYLYTIEPGP